MRDFLVSSLCCLLALSSLRAQGEASSDAQDPAPRELTIATKLTPPFVVADVDGYAGLSIELWRRIATRMGARARFVEYDLPGMLQAAENGDVDLAIAALTVTPEREARMDFSHPFLSSGLGIATQGRDQGLLPALLDRLLSFELLQALGALVLVLAICGVLMWLVERRDNPEQFGGAGLRGPAAGFWFSAVTMTTVGYGDKAPTTLAGRLITLVWMFASVMVISGYTASIASALTIDRMQSSVRGPEDLPHVRVATLAGSAAAEWLEHEGVAFVAFEDIEAAVRALADKRIEAVVYDAPILKSLLLDQPGLLVLPQQLRSEQYAIAMPRESPLRKELNRALLEVVRSEEWAAVRRRYLGD